VVRGARPGPRRLDLAVIDLPLLDLLGQAAARMLAELLRVQRLLQGAGAEPAARSGER